MADFAEQFSVGAPPKVLKRPAGKKKGKQPAGQPDPLDEMHAEEDSGAGVGAAPAPEPKAKQQKKAAPPKAKPSASEEEAEKAQIRLRVKRYTERWPDKFEGQDVRLSSVDAMARHRTVDATVCAVMEQGNAFEAAKLTFQAATSGLETASAAYPGMIGQLHAEREGQLGLGSMFQQSMQPQGREASPMAEAVEEFSIKYQHYFAQSVESKLAMLFIQLAYTTHTLNTNPGVLAQMQADASASAAQHQDL